jgi:hypothetical protein
MTKNVSEHQKLMALLQRLPLTKAQREELRGAVSRTISETVECLVTNAEMWGDIIEGPPAPPKRKKPR